MDAATVAAAATSEASPPGTPSRRMTTAQMDKDARVLYARRKMANAGKWALANDKGSKAACNNGHFGSPTAVT